MLTSKQHGAWAMLIIPFFLGMFAAGPTIWHIPLFIGWLFLYLTSYPLIMLIRKKKNENYVKWTIMYGTIALLSLIPILFYKFELLYFGLAMIPLFVINIYFAKKNNERAFMNDIVAIITFCLGGLASFYLSANELNQEIFLLSFLSFLFFLGTTFYVKTMIREKNNHSFKIMSFSYHLSLPVILLLIGAPWAIIGYIPSIIRAFVLYGKKLPIMKIGIIEIANATFFFLCTFIQL